MTIVEEKEEIEQEIRNLSQQIVMLSQMPGGEEDKPMIDPMLQKLARLKLKYKTYMNRN